MIIIAIIYLYKRNQNRFFQQTELLKLDHEKNILNTQLEIQQNTFSNISREIHDNISLSLTLAKLYLNTADAEASAKTKELISLSENQISIAMTGLRNITAGMYADHDIGSNGLIKTIEEEIGKIRKAGVHEVKLSLVGDPIFMDAQRELVIFRIIQESLNNIIKHSQARNITLELNYMSDKVRVKIQDDGIGFSEKAREETHEKRSGLQNMQTRCAMFNGSFHIESQPGQGSTIFVTIPYEQANAG